VSLSKYSFVISLLHHCHHFEGWSFSCIGPTVCNPHTQFWIEPIARGHQAISCCVHDSCSSGAVQTYLSTDAGHGWGSRKTKRMKKLNFTFGQG
jgi:hypothetical protein